VTTAKLVEYNNQAKTKKTYNEESNKDFSYVKKGMTIWYHKAQYKKWIKLLINPSKILGLDDVISLWNPNKHNAKEMLHELENLIAEYFDSRFALNDFILSRIDFTKNIRLGDKELVSAYINYLHNIKKVKGFSPKYGKMDARHDDDSSFDLKGVSNGIDFTAYDKEAAVQQNIQNMALKQKEKKERIKN